MKLWCLNHCISELEQTLSYIIYSQYQVWHILSCEYKVARERRPYKKDTTNRPERPEQRIAETA